MELHGLQELLGHGRVVHSKNNNKAPNSALGNHACTLNLLERLYNKTNKINPDRNKKITRTLHFQPLFITSFNKKQNNYKPVCGLCFDPLVHEVKNTVSMRVD